jgi:DNA-binding NarL/FixJ family response regulator
MRAALRGYLDGSDEVRVVGEVGSGEDALALARRLRPTVTLLDNRSPIADGLSAISTLARYTAVVAMTSDASEAPIASILRGGALGYLVHGEFDPPDLLRAVRAVANGHGWLSPAAASAATAALREQAGPRPANAGEARFGLTSRERDILGLLSEGLPNAAIATRLDLAEKTVKNHLNRIFAKLQVRNRTAAVLTWSRGKG